MRQFEILEHTADVKLRVFGHTEEELFQNGVRAQASILGGEPVLKTKRPPSDFEKIAVEGQNLNELLVNFLNAVLTQSQINKKIYTRVKFLKFSPAILEAQIFGLPTDGFEEDIKAVTYHEVKIKKNKRGIFETIIVLDL